MRPNGKKMRPNSKKNAPKRRSFAQYGDTVRQLISQEQPDNGEKMSFALSPSDVLASACTRPRRAVHGEDQTALFFPLFFSAKTIERMPKHLETKIYAAIKKHSCALRQM
jgi:hypothetical protein